MPADINNVPLPPGTTGSAEQAIVNDEIKIEKNAGLVMATNNSSIVSKRSVEKLYLPEPHFFRYFVKKPIRRAPTINRGYWLRMRAIDWVVQQFLEKPSDQKKVVINFGCGYDPLPFQWLVRDPALCANTKFIDVDYDLLMETKRRIIRDTPKMNDLLHPVAAGSTTFDESILIDSQEYAAIGCDLRNLRRLERLLKTVTDIENCTVLCVAEVSITYMQTEAADALIEWSSSLSSDVTFCLLEQCSPDQADNPFTMTMMKHFAKLGTPLRSVEKYPDAYAQTLRFRAAGFVHIDYNNLWELWADLRFLSPSQRCALNEVEPFDEWEEFALFASHYCLVLAHNRDEGLLVELPRSRRDSKASLSSEVSARTSSPHKPSNEWFAFRYSKEPGDLCQRHHASAYTIPNQEAVGVHGGVGTRTRLSSTAVARPRDSQAETPVILPPEMGARCCHTITPLDNEQNLLVGGRASPNQVFRDCWVQKGSVWHRVHDLPEPRYRHRVVCIVLPDSTPGAICYGGKTDARTVANDILLWEPKHGWRPLRSCDANPVPRFAPLFLRLGYNHGLLFGGMRQDGVVLQCIWRWRLLIRNGKIVGVHFRQTRKVDGSAGTWPWFARFGASYSMQRDEVLILGGIGKSGCIPKPYEILSLIGCFSNYKENEQEMPLRLGCVTPRRDPDCPRPFLIGHSTHVTRSRLSITMGGGATCFSFGNYFNTGIWILYDAEAGMSTDWVIVPVKPAALISDKHGRDNEASHPYAPSRATQIVEQISLKSKDDFSSLMRWSLPRIFHGLDFGTCMQKWSIPYLKERISPAREVIVHDAPTRSMNFLRKDFAYRSLPFHHFLSKLADPSSHLYLRSLAAEDPTANPANIYKDWPEIAADFSIPRQMQDLEGALHSAPLRISNNVSMWLHYDVMANVLFQVVGKRKLALFPPSDIDKLGFPPGSTTSTLDLMGSNEAGKEYELCVPPGTNPIIAVLDAGQALYIPALWAHTGLTLPSSPASSNCSLHYSTSTAMPSTNGLQTPDGSPPAVTSVEESAKREAALLHNPFLSISVNAFFRNFPRSAYAAGRDVYGNRDLACYEDGRRMIEKIASRFADSKLQTSAPGRSNLEFDFLPKDIRKAYLMRLAKELEQKAELL